MDTILKVCKKERAPDPKKIIYSKEKEKGIHSLEETLKKDFILPPYLLRWISLKIIDGEKKILESIEKNFSIPISDNGDIQLIRTKILENLEKQHLSNENFKDSITSSIMLQAETICKRVCFFKDKNRSR